MSSSYTIARREPYSDQVTNALRDLIVRGVLPRNERLVEMSLAKQFGVSRGPIRESLWQLETEGLVESRSPGVFVVGISASDVDELYALRDAIETLALTLAMKRAQRRDWDKLDVLVERLKTAADKGDVDAVAQADIDFHRSIYALSQNRRLIEVWSHYAPILTTLLRVTIEGHADLHDPASRHHRLLQVIRSGDSPAAVTELKDHLEDSRRRMLDAHKKMIESRHPPSVGA
jgi:GntR family transcriptional regulator, gluconate operon transcriptional repressor